MNVGANAQSRPRGGLHLFEAQLLGDIHLRRPRGAQQRRQQGVAIRFGSFNVGTFAEMGQPCEGGVRGQRRRALAGEYKAAGQHQRRLRHIHALLAARKLPGHHPAVALSAAHHQPELPGVAFVPGRAEALPSGRNPAPRWQRPVRTA